MATLEQTTKTVETLAKLHKAFGGPCRTTWPDYRAEMVSQFGLDGEILDALNRLGYFHTSENSVHFAA